MTSPSELYFPDVALVIEGGGTRNSYTAGVIEKLISERVRFGWVGGISAGASHTVNFLSGDTVRVREAFVETPAHKLAGGWGSLVRGKGYFNAEYIYETSTLPGQAFPFDFSAFQTNPTHFKIGAVRADTGEMVYWSRSDIHSHGDLVVRVRASSTMPGFMPMPLIDGHLYVDGALGPTGGFPIDAAQADGFTRFLVISSRARDYVKPPVKQPRLIRRAFRRFPAVASALIARPENYNSTRREIFELEANGNAYVFCPTGPTVSNRERNVAKLRASLSAGRTQANSEWPDIYRFLTGNSS